MLQLALLIVLVALSGDFVMSFRFGSFAGKFRLSFACRQFSSSCSSSSSSSSSSSLLKQNFRNIPVKAMIFIDATWLYYSMLVGRGEDSCPIVRKYGQNWQKSYKVNWKELPRAIVENIEQQVLKYQSTNYDRSVEISRTAAFTSMRLDTAVGSPRDTMVKEFYQAHYDVHKFVTAHHQEKCVDISLAVEMLYMSTVPDAFDIAVIVTGIKSLSFPYLLVFIDIIINCFLIFS